MQVRACRCHIMGTTLSIFTEHVLLPLPQRHSQDWGQLLCKQPNQEFCLHANGIWLVYPSLEFFFVVKLGKYPPHKTVWRIPWIRFKVIAWVAWCLTHSKTSINVCLFGSNIKPAVRWGVLWEYMLILQQLFDGVLNSLQIAALQSSRIRIDHRECRPNSTLLFSRWRNRGLQLFQNHDNFSGRTRIKL